MYILFDIGGTNMRVALSRDGETFEEPRKIPTPADFDAGILAFKNLVTEVTAGAPILAAGGGVAGKLLCTHGKGQMHTCSTILNSPHLAGWNGKALQSSLETALGCPVFIQNDAAIVGLGEAVYGAGKNYEIVAYVTISTGVGGARIVSQEIDVSAMGFEPGHQIVDAGGALGERSVGGRGVDFEGLVSGTAITERYSKKPYEITDEAFWDEMARLASYGLANTIVHWSPDALVIGGSMMNKIGIPVERVAVYLKGNLPIYPELPAVLHSTLGDNGGLYGALAFVKQKLK